jgi:hypothetical protein
MFGSPPTAAHTGAQPAEGLRTAARASGESVGSHHGKEVLVGQVCDCGVWANEAAPKMRAVPIMMVTQ